MGILLETKNLTIEYEGKKSVDRGFYYESLSGDCVKKALTETYRKCFWFIGLNFTLPP
jgi:hypothetical protein